MEGSSKGVEKNRERILNGRILPVLLWLSWPAIISNYVNMSYNLINAIWLGRLGVAEFGAPTLTSPLIWLLQSIGMAYATAGTTVISQYFGAGDIEQSRRSTGRLISFLMLLSAVVTVPGYLFTPKLVELLNAPVSIYKFAVKYMEISMLGTPLVFLSFALISAFNAYGDTRTPVKFNIASIVLNILLDPIMIFGLLGFPSLGVVGAAVTSNIARAFLAFGLLWYYLKKADKRVVAKKEDLILEKAWLSILNKIGLPLVVQNVTVNAAFSFMMGIVAYFGDAAVAAYGISLRVLDIIQSFTWGINRGVNIMIAQSLGAGKKERAEEVASISHKFIFAVLLIGSVIIATIREQIITLFVNDADVIAIGSQLLLYFASTLPFLGLFFVSSALATGSGRTLYFTIISIVRLYVFRIGLSLLFGFYLSFGASGVWLAIALSNLYAGLGGYVWARRGDWLKGPVISTSVPQGGG